MELNRKIDFAITLLQSIPQDGPVELSYSGGKDSDVILELARMSGIKFEAIYKNTTIDTSGTIAHYRALQGKRGAGYQSARNIFPDCGAERISK